jgi:hypothetical protein
MIFVKARKGYRGLLRRVVGLARIAASAAPRHA